MAFSTTSSPLFWAILKFEQGQLQLLRSSFNQVKQFNIFVCVINSNFLACYCGICDGSLLPVPSDLTPTIAYEKSFDARFPASNVLTDTCELTTAGGPRPYWLSPATADCPDTVPGRCLGFVLDLGATYCVSSIDMKNTHNSQFNDRGTNAFSFEVSTTSATDGFVAAASGSLPDASNTVCTDIPTVTASIGMSARYIRFFVDTPYGLGGGLQYIKVS